MSVASDSQPDPVVLDVGRELSSSNRLELSAMAIDALEHGTRELRLDFARTSYMDSAGIGMLISLQKHVRERGGTLRLANLNAELRALFELTRLDALFPFEEGNDGPAGAGVHAPHRPPPRAGGEEAAC